MIFVDCFRRCPYRSPRAVSEVIRPFIEGKLVCELGCAEGDNMIFMGHYAKRVIGIDFNQHRLSVAKSRNLNVCFSDYRKDKILPAEVYYFWTTDPADNDFLLKKINSMGTGATVIIGGDGYLKKETYSVIKCSEKGKLLSVQFWEGTGHRESGIFLLAVVKCKKLRYF